MINEICFHFPRFSTQVGIEENRNILASRCRYPSLDIRVKNYKNPRTVLHSDNLKL